MYCPHCDSENVEFFGTDADGGDYGDSLIDLYKCLDCGDLFEYSAEQREADAVTEIVNELITRRYPDGPPDDLDWGDVYADAYEERARRLAIGKPCAHCGAPLPPDLLCECQVPDMLEPSEDK